MTDLTQEQEMLRNTVKIVTDSAQVQKVMSDNQAKQGEQLVDYGQKIHAHTQSIEKLGTGVDTLSSNVDKMTQEVSKISDKVAEAVTKALMKPKKESIWKRLFK